MYAWGTINSFLAKKIKKKNTKTALKHQPTANNKKMSIRRDFVVSQKKRINTKTKALTNKRSEKQFLKETTYKIQINTL